MIKALKYSISSSRSTLRRSILPQRHHPSGFQRHAVFLERGEDFNLEEHLRGIDVVGYSTVAALTFLLYDIMLTFGDEVEFIWPNPWNTTKFLFFFIRYFPVMLQISIMFLGTPPFTFTERECYIWNVYQALAALLVVACVDYILILRVFALYPRNKIVRWILRLTYALEIITISVAMGLAIPELEYDELCTVVEAPVTFLIAAGAPIAFQTLLFVFTGWKFMTAVKAGWGNIPILKLLMRDGTWAFILLFCVLVSEAMLYGFATEAYTGVLYGWLNTAFSFCGYRILLNLNELNRNHSNHPSRRSRATTDAEIEFSTNFEFTRNTMRTNEYPMGALSRSSGDCDSSGSQIQKAKSDSDVGRRRSGSNHMTFDLRSAGEGES